MNYIKLIGIKIGDFYSSIEIEENYSVEQRKSAEVRKSELQDQGHICILANIGSNIVL